jgi:hypothetical protein
MKTGRVCAYCGQGSDLTSEHVFPQCFQKSFDAITTTKTPTGEKAISSDLEIHDVCGSCNHGPLSVLDTYLCELNDKYFLKIIRPGDNVRFEFNLDQLLRMLLKMGYNVARARKWPIEIWLDAKQYILDKAPCPSGFRIFLQLMIPTPAKKTTLPVSPGTTEVPPLPMSVYQLDVTAFPGLMSGYWISIWSYRFFVLQEDTRISRQVRRRSLAKWLKTEKGVYELDRRNVARVYASSVEVLDTLKASPIFHDQLSKARKLKATVRNRKSRSGRQ